MNIYHDYKKISIPTILLSAIILFLIPPTLNAASLQSSPIIYREVGKSLGYLHELDFPSGSTTKETTGIGRNYRNKVTLSLDAAGGWVYNDANSSTCTSHTVGIGTGLPDPNCSILEIRSTTKGLLLPRVTVTQMQAITYPVSGLVVYNTNYKKLCVFADPNWEIVTSALP